MESNKLSELAKTLIEMNWIKEEEIMPLLKKGTIRMLGGKETEKDIFKPIGYLTRGMASGEPIFENDIDRNVSREDFKKYDSIPADPMDPRRFPLKPNRF